MSLKQEGGKRTIEAFFPVIGMILAVCLAAIAWAFAGPLLDWSVDTFDGFDGNELDRVWLELGFGAFIFLISGAFASMLVAFAVPRKKSTVTTKDLQSEKDAMNLEKRRREKRKKEIRRKNSQKTKRIDE